jgi:hypothetical protein
MGHDREGLLIHDSRSSERATALVQFGVVAQDRVGDSEINDGVTEELETFI